jgi:hypothetical protein
MSQSHVPGKLISEPVTPRTTDQATRPGTAADTVIDEALDLTDLVNPNHIWNNGVAALLKLRGN